MPPGTPNWHPKNTQVPPTPPPPGVGRNRRIESSSLEILYAFRSVFSGEIKAKSYCVVLLTLDCFNALTMVSLNCMH